MAVFKVIFDKLKKDSKDEGVHTEIIPIERYKNMDSDYSLPILNSDQDDDDYIELFQDMISHIQDIYHGKIFCIRCGRNTHKIIKRLLEDYDRIRPDIIMEFTEYKYNIEDPNSNMYCYTEIMFTSYGIETHYKNINVKNDKVYCRTTLNYKPINIITAFSLNNPIMNNSTNYEKWLNRMDQIVYSCGLNNIL